jgi:hypothetical protein
LLGSVFIASVPDIVNNILHKDTYNNHAFADEYYAEKFGKIDSQTATVLAVESNLIKFSFENTKQKYDKATKKPVEVTFTDYTEYTFKENQTPTVKIGDVIKPGDIVAKGDFTNKVFYKNIGRILLLGLFIFISILVYKAYHKRVKEGRATL